MSVAQLLGRLRERGIELRADGERLVVDAPKGAVTEELADELRRRKPDVLAFLRLAGEAAASAAPDLAAVARLEPDAEGFVVAPASFGQRRLFYLDQLEPGLAVYNVPVAFWIDGELEPARLRAALQGVASRHAALRTTLDLDGSGVIQRVAPRVEIPFELVDLSDGPDPEAVDSRLRESLSAHACVPFDLVNGPLARAVLYVLGPGRHVLLFHTHHVVNDGWSQDVFERDLLALYADPSGAALPALPLTYADYSAWQIRSQGDAARGSRLAFWREALKAPLPLLELPTANARPTNAPTEGATERVVLGAELVEALGQLARQEGVTLFMALFAAYATLLRRVTGQEEIVIGTPVANRAQSETVDVIGYFANTVALRVDLSGAPAFRVLLGRVRDVCAGAFANQDIPFEELVEVLDVERDLSRSPVFQTLFAFEDAVPGLTRGAAEGPLRISRRETIHAKVARTDLSVFVSAGERGLVVTVEYPTALFEAEGVRRLLGHFEVLLRGAVAAPGTSIVDLPVLSAAERRCVLEEWNDTARALPAVSGAHHLVERQVDAGPERPAVGFGAGTLTYGELERRANQLAHHLDGVGVPPGSKVGIFLERSPHMVVALLAALKAGLTYVPIDPEYPPDRVVLMIEDSGLAALVTTVDLSDRLPPGARAVCLDGDAEAIAMRPTSRPTPAAFASATASERAAYLIYTSGSTGRPKGVAVPHRALINFLASMASSPGMGPDDVLLAVTTLSFDIAGLEMFLPLTVGARIVIASAEQAADGTDLRALLESSGATVMQATPASWRLLVGAGWKGGRPFKVLCGGEAFPSDLVAELQQRASEVWNMYGPTETTIWSTCARLTPEDARITIGRPIDNTAVYVLDPRGAPVPPGVAGEITIGGLGVALGYHDRPELTAERFVADPFRGGGARMYRTGDLGSFRSDGCLVYHRRLDQQVKVRGHRIELGEIEAVLSEHDGLEASAVVVREDSPGDKRLVAYTVAARGRPVTQSDLRKHLRRKLPEYMIPQHFVELAALPLTPAGKVDRKALPAPAGVVAERDARAPESKTERALAALFCDVLRVESVSATDGFFDVGGHSLLSMVVVARARKELGVTISARDLLLHTLEQLAAKLDAQSAAGAAPVASAGEPAPRGDPSPPAPEEDRSLLGRLKGKLFG